MPIPGSIMENFVDPNVADSADGFPSLATFLSPNVTTDTTGQDSDAFVPIDAGHNNQPCRRAPFIGIRPQNQEQRETKLIRERSNFRLIFPKYYADLQDTWQVVVDGVTYQIAAVESDGNRAMSRLLIYTEKPFNA